MKHTKLKKLKCWWFGCEPDIENITTYLVDYGIRVETKIPCKRCKASDIPTSELSDDSRHERAKKFLNYFLFRKWIPQKCEYCGHRYSHDQRIDHQPF